MAYYSLYELYFFNRVGIAVQCSATIFLKIYCAPPNLGITRTLIYRLNFSQWPIFSGLRFFNKPEISEYLIIIVDNDILIWNHKLFFDIWHNNFAHDMFLRNIREHGKELCRCNWLEKYTVIASSIQPKQFAIEVNQPSTVNKQKYTVHYGVHTGVQNESSTW